MPPSPAPPTSGPDHCTTPRHAHVNVDVDSLDQYCNIHGLDPSVAGNQAYEVALERFCNLFGKHGIKATFFLVGKDLNRCEANKEIVRELVRQGHEVANHTHDHPYALLQMNRDKRRKQIVLCHEQIADVTGVAPKGFRAPGYYVDSPLLGLLADLGYTYDSSVFPCLPYYGAKAAIMGAMKLRGRISKAVLGDPQMLLAPKVPHWPGHARNGFAHEPNPSKRLGLLEFPISVLPWLGLPVIGTAITMAGPTLIRRTFPLIKTLCPNYLNIEFHAVDLLELERDQIDPALGVQPDLRISLCKKERSINQLLQLVQAHYQVIRLDQGRTE